MKRKLAACFVVASFLIIGCDGYHRREVVLDLDKTPPKSFAVVETTDLNKMFDLMEKIAEKNGMTCRPYNEKQRYFGCGKNAVSVITRVMDGKSIKIEITEFGPWTETKNFSSVVDDISVMLREEFPSQNIQLNNPLKRQ